MKTFATTRIYIFFVLLAGIFIWLLCIVFHPFEPQEPRYQGKKLSDWAEEIDRGVFFGSPASPSNQLQSELAISAIRHIGTNALPAALKLCRAKDSWLKRQLWERAERYNDNNWPKRFPIQIIPAWEKNYEGANIIWALGPMAEPVIPDLIQLLQSRDREIAESAMAALPGVGTNAIPPLVQLLNSDKQNVRIQAAIVLGENFGSQAHTAVPVLLDCLENQKLHSVMRSRAIYALSFIKEDAPVIVPIMIRHIQSGTNDLPFKNQDFFISRVCFGALGHFGTNAEPAVPVLVNILESDPLFPSPESPDGSQRQAWVLGTLQKIDPGAAKPFLEKWKASLTNEVATKTHDSVRTTNQVSVQTNSATP